MHSAYYANVANGKTNGAGRWPFIDQYFSLPMGDSTEHAAPAGYDRGGADLLKVGGTWQGKVPKSSEN